MTKCIAKYVLQLSMLICILTTTSNLFADEAMAWQALRDGKAVAIMRHSLAPDGGPASKLTRQECEDERNLSDAGREQATKIGELFRTNEITNAKVYSSSWCRCVDTGVLLGFDNPASLAAINAFTLGSAAEKEQTQKLSEWIKQAITQQTNSNILVTHGFNISALTRTFTSQGDILILGVEDDQLVILTQLYASAF